VLQTVTTTAPPAPPAVDQSLLVHRARQGDREAFATLVELHQRRIWLVCRQYVGPADADGTTQDTLIKALTRLGSFDGRASFSTWLTRIAINTCLDHLRRRKRRGVQVEGDEEHDVLEQVRDDQADPEARATQLQAVARLRTAERALPDGQRAVFRLRFYAQMSLEEIAQSLEVSIGSVKTQLHRAVHKLRKELGDVR
jgi:RNA polymerase sigma-70 factor (ECF subfamily)